METIASSIPEERKNACAIHLMRTMLAKFADSHGISFDEALLRFTESDAYDTLFDFDTEVWKEGPDYLMMLFTAFCGAQRPLVRGQRSLCGGIGRGYQSVIRGLITTV